MPPQLVNALRPQSMRMVLRIGRFDARRSFSLTLHPLAVNATTHAPQDTFSTPNVRGLLSKSILSKFSDDEIKTRIELAATYRLFELLGWNENIYNHLTAKITEKDGSESFLINPFGLKYSEITASSLIKIRLDGSIVDQGVTGDLFGINDAGFVIHSALHGARKDVKSLMHSHYPPAAAVSATKQGLLELTQTCHQVGPCAYHDYHGIVVDRGEQKSLIEDAGDKNVVFLKNHGVITAGESISAAWYTMYQLCYASDMIYMAGACSMGDVNNLNMPVPGTMEKTYEVTRHKGFSGSKYGIKELSAYMRWLDTIDSSYRL